jgi:hypothetical protein
MSGINVSGWGLSILGLVIIVKVPVSLLLTVIGRSGCLLPLAKYRTGALNHQRLAMIGGWVIP